MAKKKSMEELLAEEKDILKKIEQKKHQKNLCDNRIDYLKKRKNKERTHRLITKGAAFESVFRGTDALEELEFQQFVEALAQVHEVRDLVEVFLVNHYRKAEQEKAKREEMEQKGETE